MVGRLKETFLDDARRAEEKESLRLQYIEDLKQKMEETAQRGEAQIRKLEQEVCRISPLGGGFRDQSWRMNCP